MPPPKKTTKFSEEVKNRPMTEIHEPDLSSLLESPTESFEKSRNQGDLQISGSHLVCFEGLTFSIKVHCIVLFDKTLRPRIECRVMTVVEFCRKKFDMLCQKRLIFKA